MEKFELDIVVFVMGMVLGSFLNVVAYRLPLGESIVMGRSKCPHCHHTIPFYDNIPVLSFLLLKGKCRYCGHSISVQYPLVELVTGILTWALFVRFGLTYQFLFYLVFVYFLIVIALIDLKTHLILNKLLLPLLVLGIVINYFGQILPFDQAGLGALVGGAAMYFVAWMGNKIFKKEAMGMGDVKLALVSGFFLGWQIILWALYLGFLVALVAIGILWVIRRNRLPRQLPMGPFFATGFVLNLFYGPQLLEFYLNLFN